MKRTFAVASLLLLTVCSAAQERTIALYGHVKDAFTKVGIPQTKITLMRPDSTVIDTVRVWRNPQPGASYDATYRFEIPVQPARFIIKAEHPEYEDTYIDFTIKRVSRNNYFDAPWHYMRRRLPQESTMDKELGQVTVKATRVQMYYKGDTIVFNADAFKVPEGSMLDAIIRQLPNTELKDDGQILVNGRKIDNLTLNGKDFFKGNNKVMLQNLPYYTVKQIKVFDEETERSKWLGSTVEPKEYTMDVQLKREYSIGWMANAIAGGGLSDDEGVWLGRVFALRFSDNARFTVFGNANNISEDASGHGNGDWRVNSGGSGEMRYANGGLNWTVNDPDNRISNEMNFTARHQQQDLETRTMSESYLAVGNSFGHNVSRGLNKNLNMNFSDRFFLKVPFRWVANVKAGYTQALRNSHGTALTSSQQELNDTVNWTASLGDVTNRKLNLSCDHDFDFKLSTGDVLHFNVNANYARQTNESYSQNDYRYRYAANQNAYYNRYDDSPQHDYKLNGELSYRLSWNNGFNISFFANSHYSEATEQAHYHRLDLLDDLWGAYGTHELGTLPQSQDSLRMALDLSNSYDARQHEWEIRGGAVAGYTKNTGTTHIFASACLPVRRTWMEMRYNGLLARHNYTYFSPYISAQIARDNYQKYFTFSLHKYETIAPMMSRIDRRSDANPLAVQVGNPNLKDEQHYDASFSIMLRSNKRAQSIDYRFNIGTVRDAIGQGYEYDPVSGRRTYRPVNVDGNWNMYHRLGAGKTLGQKRRWSVDLNATHSMIRTKGLATVTGVAAEATQDYAIVRNHILGSAVYVRYRVEKFNILAYGQYEWRRILHQGSARQNVSEWSYHLQANCTALPFKMTGSTSLGMFSRRGYGSADMNDNNLVWDVSLTRTFAKGHLTAILKGHDLLGQLSNVSYSVNAQGRTETWTNSLTRYVMLSLQYKFSKMPEKKTK